MQWLWFRIEFLCELSSYFLHIYSLSFIKIDHLLCTEVKNCQLTAFFEALPKIPSFMRCQIFIDIKMSQSNNEQIRYLMISNELLTDLYAFNLLHFPKIKL